MPQNSELPLENQPDKKHESDASKIVHRHLENEKDIITDDDIRNLKIDTTIGTHDLSDIGAEAESKFGTNEEGEGNTDTNVLDVIE